MDYALMESLLRAAKDRKPSPQRSLMKVVEDDLGHQYGGFEVEKTPTDTLVTIKSKLEKYRHTYLEDEAYWVLDDMYLDVKALDKYIRDTWVEDGNEPSHFYFPTELASRIQMTTEAFRKTTLRNPSQEKELQDEIWFYRDQIIKYVSPHKDKLGIDAYEKYEFALNEFLLWCSNFYPSIHGWLHAVSLELERRDPNYVEPEVNPMDDEEWEAYLDEEVRLAERDYEEQLEDEVYDQSLQITAYEALLRRVERVLSGEVSTTKEERDKLRQDIRDQTNQKYVNSTWRVTDKENIRLLTEVAQPEGHSFPVHYRDNQHFIRNLALRYGIDVSNRDRFTFNCTRLAWANNYWGTIKGFEDKGEVIISLWINKQNKGEGKVPDFISDDAWDYFFETKTTLVAKQHGDKYLELERKYAPLSADFKRYSIQDLIKAHKLIMAELNGVK